MRTRIPKVCKYLSQIHSLAAAVKTRLLLAIYKVKHGIKQKSFKEILYRKNHLKAWNDYYAMNNRSKELNYSNIPVQNYQVVNDYLAPQYNSGPSMSAGAAMYGHQSDHRYVNHHTTTHQHAMSDYSSFIEPRRDSYNAKITGTC
jgi:hypothetical protein